MPNTSTEQIEDLPYDEYIISKEVHVPNRHALPKDTLGKHGRRVEAVAEDGA